MINEAFFNVARPQSGVVRLWQQGEFWLWGPVCSQAYTSLLVSSCEQCPRYIPWNCKKGVFVPPSASCTYTRVFSFSPLFRVDLNPLDYSSPMVARHFCRHSGANSIRTDFPLTYLGSRFYIVRSGCGLVLFPSTVGVLQASCFVCDWSPLPLGHPVTRMLLSVHFEGPGMAMEVRWMDCCNVRQGSGRGGGLPGPLIPASVEVRQSVLRRDLWQVPPCWGVPFPSSPLQTVHRMLH